MPCVICSFQQLYLIRLTCIYRYTIATINNNA
jgi:hypothetical protein